MTRSLVTLVCSLVLVAPTMAAPPPDDPAPETLTAGLAAWMAAAGAGDDATCSADAGPPCVALRGVAVFHVSARVARAGHRLVCRTRCAEPIAGTVLLDEDDAGYRIPHGTVRTCPIAGAPDDLPDEVGRVRTRRRTRLLLPANRDQLAAALGACSGSVVRVRQLRRALRPAADGATLEGTGALRLEIDGTPAIRVRASSRFVGATAGVDAPEAPTLADSGLPACRESSLTVRCRLE